MPSPHVVVIGGGLAGLAASIALAENGARVSLVEKQPRLGGRATSYLLPSGEYIDNCQHVTLRCCTNLEDFYRRIGVSEHIEYKDRLVFADSKGRRAEIKSSRLPAPLHVAPSFAAFPLLSWQDKRSIALAMFRIMRTGGELEFTGETTMLAWLKRNRQTQHAIDHFWRVVLVSALNEELDRIDAAHGISVFWKAFLSNRNAFGIGIPAVPLEVLYASVADRIKRAGGDVRIRCGVSELCMSNGELSAVRLDEVSLLQGDYYVAAIPFDRLLKIVPESFAEIEAFANIARLNVSPITSVHVWLDRSVMKEPFLASVDQTIQWVFNKTGPSGSGSTGQYLQVVISASRALAQQSQQDIIAMCRKELGDLIPESAGAKWIRAIVIRENAATFSPEPGADRWRPSVRTPIRNLLLAGDWTQTGWPATMEGAVRSGYGAAEAILGSEGRLVHLVRPELPVSRLVSWLKLTRRN